MRIWMNWIVIFPSQMMLLNLKPSILNQLPLISVYSGGVTIGISADSFDTCTSLMSGGTFDS